MDNVDCEIFGNKRTGVKERRVKRCIKSIIKTDNVITYL